jgi:hypothetical protein
MKSGKQKSEATTSATPTIDPQNDLQRQRDYVDKLNASGFNYSIVVADAFVRGMRDIGYRSTANAINELVDNSVQAGASRVVVELKTDGTKDVEEVAVLDNGHGMEPGMIRAAVVFGGTHRENDRASFGRYGYGLKTAAVSFGRRFTIYSKTSSGTWNSVYLDIDEVGRGGMRNEKGEIIVPMPKQGEPPKWPMEQFRKRFPEAASGTIIHIEKIDRDRLTFKKHDKLQNSLLEAFGVVYRNYLHKSEILVSDKVVEPIDPLFTTPGYRFYDEDEDRAIALPPLLVDVKSASNEDVVGRIRIRYCVMPPTFLRIPESKMSGRGTHNKRNKIRKEHNGIIVLRAGRQLDVVRSVGERDLTFMNNDRYIGIEIDFDPVLDEEFRVTTAKQQVVPSSRICDILEKNGFFNTITDLRNRYKALQLEHLRKLDEKSVNPTITEMRPSETAMAEAQTLLPPSPEGQTVEQQRAGQKRLEQEAKKVAETTGMPVDVVQQQLAEHTQQRPFKVDFEALPGAPFYRVEQLGGQRVLRINTEHAFYKELYMAPGTGPKTRYGLEVLLFVIGKCELDSKPERQLWYQTERARWSTELIAALGKLSEWDPSEVEEEDADLGQPTASVA